MVIGGGGGGAGGLFITWVLCTGLWDDVLSVFDDCYLVKNVSVHYFSKDFHGQAYHKKSEP